MTLTIDDFVNPLFDKTTPRRHYIPAREEIYHLLEDDDFMNEEEAMMMGESEPQFKEKKELAIEGVTVTDNFNQVGYTYCLLDGMLFVNYWNKKEEKNVRLIEKPIKTYEDFDKCLKAADRKIMKKYR
ncbi:MAG: hypothetical protein ABIB43_04675 [archaeon]